MPESLLDKIARTRRNTYLMHYQSLVNLWNLRIKNWLENYRELQWHVRFRCGNPEFLCKKSFSMKTPVDRIRNSYFPVNLAKLFRTTFCKAPPGDCFISLISPPPHRLLIFEIFPTPLLLFALIRTPPVYQIFNIQILFHKIFPLQIPTRHRIASFSSKNQRMELMKTFHIWNKVK